MGTCQAFGNLSPSSNPPNTSLASADAGTKFTVSGPNNEQIVVTGGPGQSHPVLSAAGTFLTPGAFTVSGTGGADIGPFTAAIAVNSLPTLISPLPSQATPTVTRSNGMTFTWNTAGATGSVLVVVQSATDKTFTTGATVGCYVPASAGSFTIPGYAMLALPAGNFGEYELSPRTTGSFTAGGLNLGIIQYGNDGTVGALNLQ
jgi:hypothetical protein